MTQAYHRLRDLLVRGTLPPGYRIVEKEVAERFGISRTPLRGALQRLQQEGFIDVPGNGGPSRWMVAALTGEDARELFSIVGSIEGMAARRAAAQSARARQPLVVRLTELNTALRDAAQADRPDRNTLFTLDMAFHRRYVEAAAGPRLLALHDSIKPQAERYIRLYISALAEEIDESVLEHAVIITEIERGDSEAAKRAVESNWQNAGERLGQVIRDLGERGGW